MHLASKIHTHTNRQINTKERTEDFLRLNPNGVLAAQRFRARFEARFEARVTDRVPVKAEGLRVAGGCEGGL